MVFEALAAAGAGAPCPRWLPQGTRLESITAGPDASPLLYRLRLRSPSGRLRFRLEARTEYVSSGTLVATSRSVSGQVIRVFHAIAEGSRASEYIAVAMPNRHGASFIAGLTGALTRRVGVAAVTRIASSVHDAPRPNSSVDVCRYERLAAVLAHLMETGGQCSSRSLSGMELDYVFGTKRTAFFSMSVGGRPPHVVFEWTRDHRPPGHHLRDVEWKTQARGRAYFNRSSTGSPGLHSDHYIVVVPTSNQRVRLWISVHASNVGAATSRTDKGWLMAVDIVQSLKDARAPR